jgi:hypothetical protein
VSSSCSSSTTTPTSTPIRTTNIRGSRGAGGGHEEDKNADSSEAITDSKGTPATTSLPRCPSSVRHYSILFYSPRCGRTGRKKSRKGSHLHLCHRHRHRRRRPGGQSSVVDRGGRGWERGKCSHWVSNFLRNSLIVL